MIDVDGHNYPNLCLMKLSAYHKSLDDHVEWYRDDPGITYDIVYMSKVFSDAYSADLPEPTNAVKVIKGGTGYAIKLENGKEVYHKELDPPLPPEIETMYPDYSLYPQYTGYGLPLKKQTIYGYLTRGCPRGCAFCHVAAKEGKCAHKVANLSQFWRARSRLDLFRANPPSYVLPLTWRPDFLYGAKSGSPTMECLWTVWSGGHDTIYYPLEKPKGDD